MFTTRCRAQCRALAFEGADAWRCLREIAGARRYFQQLCTGHREQHSWRPRGGLRVVERRGGRHLETGSVKPEQLGYPRNEERKKQWRRAPPSTCRRRMCGRPRQRRVCRRACKRRHRGESACDHDKRVWQERRPRKARPRRGLPQQHPGYRKRRAAAIRARLQPTRMPCALLT